jgi:hypothetical protein
VFLLCVLVVFFLAGMASKRSSFGDWFSGRASLSSSFLSLNLYSSIGFFGTRASQWSSSSLSGHTAFSHGHVGLLWSVHDLHASRFSFFVSAGVGHGFLFLVLAGGGDGFRRSAVTGVMFVYNACCSRASIDEDFQTTACLTFLLCICLM